jgi:hypothetical protein
MKYETRLSWLPGLVLAFFVGAPAFAVSESPERVADFALLDHTGKYHRMSYYGDHAVLVLAAHGLA